MLLIFSATSCAGLQVSSAIAPTLHDMRARAADEANPAKRPSLPLSVRLVRRSVV
jgi:hypothetical protein